MNGIHSDLDIMILERLEPNSLQDAARVRKFWRHYIEHCAYKMRSISADVIHLTLFSTNDISAQLVTIRNKETLKWWSKPVWRLERYTTKEEYDIPVNGFLWLAYQEPIPHITKIMKYSVKELRITFERQFPKDENGLKKLNIHLPKWWIARIRRLRLVLDDDNEPIAFPAMLSRFAYLDDFILSYYCEPRRSTIMEGIKTQASRYAVYHERYNFELDGEFLRELTQQSKLHPITTPVLKPIGSLILTLDDIVTFITETQFAEGYLHEIYAQFDGNTEDWYNWKEKNTECLNAYEAHIYCGYNFAHKFEALSFKFRNRMFMVWLMQSRIGIGRCARIVIKEKKYFI